MNNQIHNRKTRVHFKLGSPISAMSLAGLIESVLLREGFKTITSQVSLGAESVTEDGLAFKRGSSLQEVIPNDSQTISFASGRYADFDLDLKISIQLGGENSGPFNGYSQMDFFTLVANCRMDRMMLPSIALSIPSQAERQESLKCPKRAYSLIKRMFHILAAEKCIGVDDKHYTASYFDDPPAFFFSRSEPIIPSELLEESD